MEKDSGVRTLPVIRIHDTEFLVDIKNMEFIQFDNHENKISFRDVRDLGTHTEVSYDPVTKNAFKGTLQERLERKDIVEAKLPAAIDLDTQGLADEIVINVRKQREQKNESSESTKPKEELKQPKKHRGHRR